jgi:hypothetical protein
MASEAPRARSMIAGERHIKKKLKKRRCDARSRGAGKRVETNHALGTCEDGVKDA